MTRVGSLVLCAEGIVALIYRAVPGPGCWRDTASTGHISGSVVFSATD